LLHVVLLCEFVALRRRLGRGDEAPWDATLEFGRGAAQLARRGAAELAQWIAAAAGGAVINGAGAAAAT
jgi:hypothetical protein